MSTARIAERLASLPSGAQVELYTIFYNPNARSSYRTVLLYSLSVKYGFSLDTPYGELMDEVNDMLMNGVRRTRRYAATAVYGEAELAVRAARAVQGFRAGT